MPQLDISSRSMRNISPVTTKMMRVVLSGVQPQKKRGIRILSLTALLGAGLVCCVYLVIPLMICLHLNDFMLSVLLAAFLLTLAEGLVGFILFRIDSSYEIAVATPHIKNNVIAMPTLSTPTMTMPSILKNIDMQNLGSQSIMTQTPPELEHTMLVEATNITSGPPAPAGNAVQETVVLATMKMRTAPIAPSQPLLTLPMREPA